MMRLTELRFSQCAKLESLLVGMIVLATILHRNSLISLCFALSFVVLLAYTFYRATVVGIDVLVLALVCFSLVNVFSNAFFSGKRSIGFDYFKKVIMFSAFVLLMDFSSQDSVDEKTADLILTIPCVAGVLLILSYFVGGNTRTVAGGITLGFTNTNFTGMWLLHLSVFFFVMLVSPQKRLPLRAASLLCYGICLWLILLTKARSCLIGVVLFLALCLTGQFQRGRFALHSKVIFLITILPIVVVFLYNTLLSWDWFLDTFSFLNSEGKSLHSRQGVWNPAIQTLKSHLLLGDYYGISKGTGMSQLHNTHLDVLCSYGIVPFLLFLRLLYNCIRKTAGKPFRYGNYCALCGFLAITVMGAFEAAVVSGSMGLNLLTAALLILANRNSTEGL